MNVARHSRNQKNLTTKRRSHEDSHAQGRGASCLLRVFVSLRWRQDAARSQGWSSRLCVVFGCGFGTESTQTQSTARPHRQKPRGWTGRHRKI